MLNDEVRQARERLKANKPASEVIIITPEQSWLARQENESRPPPTQEAMPTFCQM